MGDTESLRVEPAAPVNRPLMQMSWRTLTFLHWPYEPAWVQALLPPGMTVQTFDGRAWVGLVPFEMVVRWPGGPVLPWLSRFPETNVRTYVTGPDGTAGVWFFSLDAARLPAVAAARAGWGLPYYWNAQMSVVRQGLCVRYRSRRTWPWPAFRPAASLDADILVGEPIPAAEVGPFEHHVTARFALWARRLGRNFYSRAEHPRWTLRRAEVRTLDTSLLAAAGLGLPPGDPNVLFSEGVDVRVGRPAPANAGRREGSAKVSGAPRSSRYGAP